MQRGFSTKAKIAYELIPYEVDENDFECRACSCQFG